jgi:hypothetical protein
MKVLFFQPSQYVACAERLDIQGEARNQPAVFRREKRDRMDRRGDRADGKMATRHAAYQIGFLPQPFKRGKHLPRPGQYALALRRDAWKLRFRLTIMMPNSRSNSLMALDGAGCET